MSAIIPPGIDRLARALTEPYRRDIARLIERGTKCPAPPPEPSFRVIDCRERMDTWTARNGRERWYVDVERPNPRARRYWRGGRRRTEHVPTELKGACLHQLGIDYGVRGSYVRTVQAELDAGTWDQHWAVTGIDLVDLSAHEAALIDRMCGRFTGRWDRPLPYHAVYLRETRNWYLLHPPERITWAGNGSNDQFYQVGIDGDYPGWESQRSPDHSPPLTGNPRTHIVEGLDRILTMFAVPRVATAHARWSDARGRDPGEELWGLMCPCFDSVSNEGPEPAPGWMV